MLDLDLNFGLPCILKSMFLEGFSINKIKFHKDIVAGLQYGLKFLRDWVNQKKLQSYSL